MNKDYYFFISTIMTLLLGIPQNTQAQRKDYNVRTETFVLRTSKTDDSALYKINQLGDRETRKTHYGRLEMKSTKMSVFRIEDINPLRYYYFINNQLVTQFMDASPTLFGKNTTNQGNSLAPSTISFLKLFQSEKNKNDLANNSLDSLVDKIKQLRDDFNTKKEDYSNTQSAYFDTLDSIEIVTPNKSKLTVKEKAAIKVLEKKENDSKKSFVAKYEQLQTAIVNYEDVLSQKIFNLTKSGILENFRKYYVSRLYNDVKKDTFNEIVNQMFTISEFPDSLQTIFNNRDLVLNILSSLGNNSNFNTLSSSLNLTNKTSYIQYNPLEFSTKINSLSSLLQSNFGIALDKAKLTEPTKTIRDFSTDVERLMEIFRIKKLMSTYIFDFCEQFILKTTVDIGELLQIQVFELSRFKNEIQNYDYIDRKIIDSVNIYRTETKNIFEFIQKTSTDLSVYANAIQASGKSFQLYLNNIDSNYAAILDYLKIFDFVNANNTAEYTLPTSSNSSNADFVRYSVSRLDKNTSASEDLTYDIWLRGGLKIDFSVGFFASGLVDNQYQKLFISTDPITNTDSIQVHRVHDGGYNFGFGGMVNITRRPGSNWAYFGGSFGVIYSNNQKLQVIGGFAIHLGKTERIILHAGVAAGTVKSFDDSQLQYSSNTIKKYENWGFRVPSYTDYAIPSLIDKFTVRPFFGLSYNLSKSSPLTAISDPGLSKYNSVLLNPNNSSGSTK